VSVAALAAQRGEPQEAEGRRGVAGGDRVVADLLAPRDQILVVGGGREEGAALGVAEAIDHRLRYGLRLLVPALLEARFVQRQERLEQERVVLEVGVEASLAVAVGAQQVPLGVAQRPEDELGAGASGVEVLRPPERRSGLGQGADRERVPRGEALV